MNVLICHNGQHVNQVETVVALSNPKWQKHSRRGGATPDAFPAVTLRKNAIVFNSIFITGENLDDKVFVVIYTNSDEFSIGFRFLEDASGEEDAYSLTNDGGSKSKSRAVQVTALMKDHRWISAVALQDDVRVRRFQPVWDKFEKLWVISLCPAFENRVTDRSNIPSSVDGIYRYRRGEEIVYIGKGQIRSRLNSPEREAWDFDLIEYSVVCGDDNQHKWETYWLDRYVDEFGRLPFYNRIGGKRQ